MAQDYVVSAATPPRREVPWPPYRWDFETEANDPVKEPTPENLALIKDALDLLVELWPKPGYRTVTLESHQWAKLRQLLLAIPALAAGDE